MALKHVSTMMKLLVALVSVALAGVSFGQSMPNLPHLTFQDRTAFLLTASSIREDLELSDVQRKSIDRYWKDHAQRIDDMSRKPNFTQKQMENLDKSVAGQSISVLNPNQKTRLKQLGFQNIGPRALTDLGIAREFGLGPRQLELITNLYRAYDAKLDGVDEKIADALGGENVPKDGQKRADYDARRNRLLKLFETERAQIRKGLPDLELKAIDVLNGDQASQWKKAQGKPFAFVGNKQ